MHATIVGAGVSGLTTATALADVGWSVDIVAAKHFDDTVSTVAAAIWTMTAAEPQLKARRWALTSRDRFAEFALDPTCGIAPLMQREFERVDPGPSWWESTPYVKRMAAQDVPDGYAAGFEIDGFIIEPPRYLGWLTDRLADRGVTVTTAHVDALSDLDGDLIVNCAGLAAQELVGDDSMFPIRGQVVAVTHPGISDGVADESDIDRVSYVYPRSTEVILGGARQTGDTDLSPDAALTDRILTDAAVLDPRIAGAQVLDVRVGLRPGRPQVRVEAEQLNDGRTVVHNYGHGGAGFLLSWGCAGDVAQIAIEKSQVSAASGPSNPSPFAEDEEGYVASILEERALYAWALEHFGQFDHDTASLGARRFYTYESPHAYRGIEFHEHAWHWAMREIHGDEYWIQHPDLAEPPPAYGASI